MTGQQNDPIRLFFFFPSGMTACRGIKHLADCSTLQARQKEQRAWLGTKSNILCLIQTSQMALGAHKKLEHRC